MKEIYYKNKLTAVGNHIKLKKYQDFDAGTRTGLTLEETPDGAVSSAESRRRSRRHLDFTRYRCRIAI